MFADIVRVVPVESRPGKSDPKIEVRQREDRAMAFVLSNPSGLVCDRSGPARDGRGRSARDGQALSGDTYGVAGGAGGLGLPNSGTSRLWMKPTCTRQTGPSVDPPSRTRGSSSVK